MVEIIKQDEDQEDKRLIETIDLDQLVEGNSIFESKGVSFLKVTQRGRFFSSGGWEDDKIRRIAIPIKSSGVSEMVDEFERSKKPMPPKKRELVKKDSDLGREIRLTKNEYAWVYDFTDEQYVSETDKYNQDLGMKILMMGLDLPIRDREGNEITDDSRRLEVLKGMGLTGEHLSQLVDDIRSLTQWQEDKENDFLAR